MHSSLQPGLGWFVHLSVCLSTVKRCCCVGLELELPPGPVQAEPSQKCQPAGQRCLLLPQPLWLMGGMKKKEAVGKLQLVRHCCRVALLAVTSLLALHRGTPAGMGSGGAEHPLGSPGLFWGSLPTSPPLSASSSSVPLWGALRRADGLFLLQDLEKESDTPLQQVSIEEILEEQRVEQQAKQESEKLKVQALKERGLSVPRADTLDEY